MLTVGGYALTSMVGRGGMAQVWRGRRPERQGEVAVKLTQLRGEGSLADAQAAEVRAVAALDHPNIVKVLDYGLVSPEESAALGGSPPEGALWLAMELCAGGSLRPRVGRMTWRQLRSCLLQVLAGLAHAHARGLTHLDLKPDNVLLTGAVDEALRVADFGLSWALEEGAPVGRDSTSGPEEVGRRGSRIWGTPAYMAPEQAVGTWRDWGPWTDLYAVGAMAWELATGAPPFVDGDPSRVVSAHIRSPLPRLRTAMALPDGVEPWLACLLSKHPDARFPSAAAAAVALASLPEVVPLSARRLSLLGLAFGGVQPQVGVGLRPEEEALAPTLEMDAPDDLDMGEITRTFDAGLALSAIQAGDAAGAGTPTRPGAHFPRPSADPRQWDDDDRHTADPPLHEISTNLYHLRPPPLVARRAERAALWEGLCQTFETGQPHAWVLRGPSGTGKSRLASWLGERAAELGLAERVRVLYGERPGPADGLRAMVSRHLRTQGLPPSEARWRLSWCSSDGTERSPWLVQALMAWLYAPAGGPARARAGAGDDGPEQRYNALWQELTRSARERVVLVWIDDAQWGEEALAFVEFCLRRAEPARVHFVLTVQEEALAARDAERRALDRLFDGPRCTQLHLGPLPPAEHRVLVDRLLGIHGRLAESLADRTRGNPLFAVQLVGDWVDKGWLVPSPAGLQLKGGVTPELPDSLHTIWVQRAAQLLRGRPPTWAWGLQLAAVLGQTFSEAEWSEAADLAGLPAEGELLEALVSHRVVEPLLEGGGEGRMFSFSHAMLRESLERIAREEGNLVALHGSCARMLEQREKAGDVRWSERLCLHLLGAEEYVWALDPLEKSVDARLEQGQGGAALRLIERWEGCQEQAALPADHPARHRLSSRRALAHFMEGDGAAAWSEHSALLRRLEVGADPVEHAREMLAGVRYLRLLGRSAEAWEQLNRARELCTRVGDPSLELLSGVVLAIQRIKKGQLREAAAQLESAAPLVHQVEDVMVTTQYYDAACQLATLQQRLGEAVLLAQAGRALAEAAGKHVRFAELSVKLAWARLEQRAFDEAERLLLDSLPILRGSGDIFQIPFTLNLLGEVYRRSRRDAAAAQTYERCLAAHAALASPFDYTPRYNLALSLLARGQIKGALTHLEMAEARARQLGDDGIGLALDIARVWAFSLRRDWAGVEVHLRGALLHLGRGAVVQSDDVDCAHRARQVLTEQGQGVLAARLSELMTKMG